MKLELDVLVSSSIKRKKPWPKLAFLGEAEESVFLLDSNRVSVLYLPSGKTKKKIPKIHSLVSEAVTLTHSNNGHFILGLMSSGDLFLWHKDSDLLRFIPGINDLTKNINNHHSEPTVSQSVHENHSSHTFHLFIADDGCKLIVTIDTCEVYVWELDPRTEMFHSSTNSLQGSWSTVVPPTGTLLPEPHNIETSLDAVFMINEAVNGLCLELSFVFNHCESVCVTSLILTWYDVQNVFAYRHPTFTAQWNTVLYPLTSVIAKGQPIRVPGAYVSSQSHDGNLLAVAVNQLDTYKNKMMFISLWTDTVVVVDMKGMGTKEPLTANARSHWVSDMRWTADDLFVACVTHQGSLCILTRLGEPLMLQSHGCNMEMGPKPYLPLHPLISVRTEEDDRVPQSEQAALMAYECDAADPLHQKFSIAIHPRLPLILVSDGFMVTALQLPSDITCLTMMKGLVKESSHHLSRIKDQKKIKLTLFDRNKLLRRIGLQPDNNQKDFAVSAANNICAKKYMFEEEEGDTGLDTTQDSDIADFILAGELNVGKITFGDVENLNATIDFTRFSQDDGLSVGEHIIRAQRVMTLAWSLGASHIGLWTSDHEDICHHVIHNMIHLFGCLMHADSKTLNQLDQLQVGTSKKTKGKGKRRPLQKVLGLFKQMMRLLFLDGTSHHMMVCAFGFIHSFLDFLLRNNTVRKKHSQLQILTCCYMVLRYCDTLLSKVYARLPGSSYHGGLAVLLPKPVSYDLCVPTFLTEFITTKKLSALCKPADGEPGKQQDAVDVDDDGYSSQLSARSVQESSDNRSVIGFVTEKQTRLLPLWQLLYKKTEKHFQSVARQCEDIQEYEVLLHEDLEKTLTLIKLLQHVIQGLGGQIRPRQRHRLIQGDKLYIEGCLLGALESWMLLIEQMPDDKLQGLLGSRVFHSLFYALVLSDQLRKAMTLVKSVIWQDDIRKSVIICKENTKGSMFEVAGIYQNSSHLDASNPNSVIKSKPVRQLLQTLGRLMATYFSNGSMFVYPPHAPKRLPSIYSTNIKKNHIVPLCRNRLTSLIREEKLGEIWTPECALECLMMSGLYTEAVWFVHQLGDWKTAFIMSVASDLHHDLAPVLYRNTRLLLPEELTPEHILKSHLQSAFFPADSAPSKEIHLHIDETTDFDQLTTVLRDILLTSVVCKVELVTLLLHGLLDKLKSLAARFTVLVPDSFYLPAPPIHCPQPAQTTQEGLSAEARNEIQLRKQMSSVFHLILLVLNSSGVTKPAAAWYAQKVFDAVDKGTKLQKTTFNATSLDIKVLQEAYLREPSSFDGHELTPAVHTVLSSFREMCSITWMLYARDKLSLCLRNKAKMAEKGLTNGLTVEQWQEHCVKTLNWTKQLIPFSAFLNGDADLHGCLLSLILELPHSADTAKIMAEYFSHPENLDPEIQDKLQWILKEWQGVFLRSSNTLKQLDKEAGIKIESPRGVTMSLFFNSSLDRASRMEKKRKKLFGFCENQLLVGEELGKKEKLVVGSRYFESTQEYLEFLDVLYAVSFHRLAVGGKDKPLISQPDQPLLVQYSKLHKQIELDSLSSERSEKKFHGLNTITIDPSPKPIVESSSNQDEPVLSRGISPEEHGGKGLFKHRKLKMNIEPSLHESDSSNPETKKSGYRNGPLMNGFVPESELRECDRSLHLSDLDDDSSVDDFKQTMRDPLLGPLMPAKLLDGLKLDKRFLQVENLLDWLTDWASRNHTLLTNNFMASSRINSAIRVRMPPKMIMYSLWLLENCYNAPPSATAAAVKPEYYQEITVATVCCHSPRSSNKDPEQERMRMADNEEMDPDNFKKKNKKKKKKKKDKSKDSTKDAHQPPEDDIPDVRSADESCRSYNMYPDDVVKQMANESMRSEQSKLLSITETGYADGQSEMTETLTFTSLRDEELMQTVKQAVTEIQSQSFECDEMDGDLSSQQATLNNTLRFHDVNQTKQRQHSPKRRQLSSENSIRERQTVAVMTSSQPSDMSAVAQELQGIVRQELRKIMEAQHKGILAMLGALDDKDDDGLGNSQSRVTPNSSLGQSGGRITGQRDLSLSQLGDSKNLNGLASSHNISQSDLSQALRHMKLSEDQRESCKIPNQREPNQSHDAGEHQQLYKINLELPGQQPQLLRLPSQPPAQEVHLPSIPQQAWPERSTSCPRTGYKLQDIPERDIGSSIQLPEGQTSILNTMPFPLLTLNQPSAGPGYFPGAPSRVPTLIPPEEILSYEEHQYKANTLKSRQVFQFVNEQMANQMAAQKQPEPIGKHLLKPDVFEPFGPVDERDKKQREKHRVKKSSTDGTESKQKAPAKERSRTTIDDESKENTLHSLTESELRSQVSEHVSEPIVTERKEKQGYRSVKEDKSDSKEHDEDIALNHGYALTPGLFDEYLKNQDELGSVIETNAQIQYKAATAVQTTPRTRKDACTETSLLDRERALSQSTGTDPVSDAVKKYYEAKTGHTSTILSPDVFLALQFNENNRTAEVDGTQPSRAFLNVVDINADIFDEIHSSAQQREGRKQVQQRTELKLPSQRASALNNECTADVSPERDHLEGGDHVTARLLGRPASPVDPVTAEAVMYSSRRQRTREDICKKLENMNMQFNAIDSMNTSIEREFKDSELLLHTIEKMAESLIPEENTSPSTQQQHQQQQQEHGADARDFSHIKTSTIRPKKVQISDVGQSKEEEMPDDLRRSKEDTGASQELGYSGQSELQKSLEVSGLSGVSDILGEMLLRGDMTPEQLGISQKQADHLAQKARASSTRISQEELQKIFSKKPSTEKTRTEEQIRELHEWMAEKQRERLRQYREQLDQLRAGEHHPYKPHQESPRGKPNKDQLEKKKQQSEEFMKKREEEASRLMGDILADLSAIPISSSLPTTPRRGRDVKSWTPSSNVKSRKKSPKGISGKTVVRKISRSPGSTSRSRSPLRDRSRNVQAMGYMDLPVDGHMHAWTDDMNGMIDSRTKVIQPRDIENAQRMAQKDDMRVRSAPPSPPRARKQKKFTDLVRLQRPQVTRQTHRNKPLTYTERLAQLQADGSTPRTTSSAREQYKIYGSKHLPGSARLSERRAPRVVKTYTERLAELRQQGESPSSADATKSRLWNQRRGISPRKPGKTLTYAERLQQLQPPKGTTRSSTESVMPQPKPGYKWHKAPHKPKTYVEQLQELQKPATVKPRDTHIETNVHRAQPAHATGRTRPYADPYTETEDDRLSVISPWSMEEDVKRLLYEEDSIMERVGDSVKDVDVSEVSEIEYYIGDEPEDYTALVDVGELAEIASISEASVMSFIDWDQVDQLIAEA